MSFDGAVALVLASSTGGVGQHVASLARGLVAGGATVTVCGPAATDERFRFSDAGARFEAVEIPPNPRVTDARAVGDLRRAIGAVDVVHAHGLRAGFVAALVRPRPPLVVTWHNAVIAKGLRGTASRLAARAVARAARVTLGASDDLVETARDLGARDARLSPVAAPVLPPPRRSRAAVRAEFGLPAGSPKGSGSARDAGAGKGSPTASGSAREAEAEPDSPTASGSDPTASGSDAGAEKGSLKGGASAGAEQGSPKGSGSAHQAGREPALILSVGRLHPQKRYDVLIDAAARWRELDPAPVVVIAGSGPAYMPLAARVSEMRAPVTLLGHRNDVADLLAGADLAVVTSDWEARQLFAQEALRAGVALVTTAVGGVPGLVGDAARLVPPDDVDAVDAAVRELLADPELRADLARRGPAQADTWPDEADTVGAVQAVYAEVVAAETAHPS